MPDPTGLGSADVSVALLLAAWLVLVTCAATAFDVTGRLAGTGGALGVVSLLPGLALGLATWTGTALLILDHAPGSARFDLMPLAAALLLATAGGAVSLRTMSRKPTELAQLASGASLGGIAVVIALLFVVGGHGLWPNIDYVVIVVTLAGGTAAGASAAIISRLPMGYGADAAASAIYAATVALATYSVSHALPELPQGNERFPDALAVSVETVAILAVLGAGGCVLLGMTLRAVEVRLRMVRDAERVEAVDRWQALTVALVRDAGPPFRALRGCLDLMSSEPLALPQRRRLDAARDCASELSEVFLCAKDMVEARPALDDAPAAGRRGTALVVDDSDLHRDVARIILQRAGFDVRVAASADAALAVLGEAPVDIAFIDARMTGMDGFALTEAIRCAPHLAETIVVGLSTCLDDDKAEAQAADMDDLVAKPLCRATVEAVASRWLLAAGPDGMSDPAHPAPTGGRNAHFVAA